MANRFIKQSLRAALISSLVFVGGAEGGCPFTVGPTRPVDSTESLAKCNDACVSAHDDCLTAGNTESACGLAYKQCSNQCLDNNDD